MNYAKTREVYVQYRKARYSRKFFEEHREEITIHKAAKDAFTSLHIEKLPKVKELNMEYAQVMNEKKSAYAEYRNIRKEMQEYVVARKTVAILLDIESEKNQKESQKQDEINRNKKEQRSL